MLSFLIGYGKVPPMKILSIGLFLFPASLALAAAPVDCSVVGSEDGILHVSVGPTDLEGQIAAYTTIQTGSSAQSTLVRVSNGSVDDERIYLFESNDSRSDSSTRPAFDLEPAPFLYFLEHAGSRNEAYIVRYSRCQPQPGLKDCSSEGLRARGVSGRAECTIRGK